MPHTLVSLAAAVALAAAGTASSPPAPPVSSQVVTVVAIPTPAGIDHDRLVAGMEAAVPQYRAVPGLIRKYFTIGDGNFGGVYLWRDRAAAEAWFTAAWHQRVVATYGRDGTVSYLEVPVAIDGTRP